MDFQGFPSNPEISRLARLARFLKLMVRVALAGAKRRLVRCMIVLPKIRTQKVRPLCQFSPRTSSDSPARGLFGDARGSIWRNDLYLLWLIEVH
ncbi:hypothetical protein THAOC_35964 [Thalassiosira oceanica]|uniref:Uncharacterized protein n=1 Tax=Thalassiosira oceanica TaxID=159749 RepID=K0RFR2_THAOC|nr:hypothetical protein THAOC_35964 [Thalassiosira oceanica]|eukprot:EJK45422.1 hypothetical protein THAOC_35964 [Thalassiosira oceanica]